MANGSTPGNRNLWIGIAIAAAAILVLIVLIVLLNGGDDETGSATTTASPTTTTAATTTTEPAVTTTEAATTTTAQSPSGTLVAESPIVGVLQPYNDGGAALFPPGSVEAHWYRWEDLYVVLYRGIDAETTEPLCAGNSIDLGESRFRHVSDSPFGATADEVCVDAPKLAEGESGVQSCGSLLYSITEIPIDEEGVLYGTLEVNDGSGFVGQTSQATADLAATPEFLPFQAAYTLPPSGVDEGGVVLCGS